ncbi:3-oxoacyl-[acyl-carrier-protein] synthase 3 [Allorhodopirellula heiligendammensis]|uniref:Beta-ketoacyl-[acyl-carrier-protein] synthase III n=1 Tax=Allorhodopirellula heiligendammensis TaxID=2714739 RepID=A0A5C6BDW9_9BACT|nr:beta-ketoacyl-ACP synthase III [Allorhodopirellula heiligendammensis]TWU10170.1 3-oxoacyl-[acyl-carrier-protein] synthase 3 [Allorhodopirellula heiligendammensis]
MHTEPAHESPKTSVLSSQSQASGGNSARLQSGSDIAPAGTSAESALARGHVTEHGRLGRVGGIRIAGTGSYVPEQIVTNEDLANLGCDSDWIVRRTGIRQRRHAAADEATSDMCFHAANRCMQNAGVTASEVDLVLVATITPDHQTPSTASQLQGRLGIAAPAMDLGVACSGFTYALVTAAQFIAAGNAKNVLIVGADLMTRTVDPDDKKIYPLFGDAAGAVLVTPTPSGSEGGAHNPCDPGPATEGLISYQLGSEGIGGEMLCVPAGGSRQTLTPEAYAAGDQFMKMDGRNVFKWAVRVVDESAKDVLAHAGVAADDIALLILHQANQRIIDSAVAGLGVDPARVFVNLDRYGNTSAASIPLALDEAVQAGRLQRGDLLLMSGFGAGLAWGTLLLRW